MKAYPGAAMFFLLLACAPESVSTAAPPAPWYYASTGDDIDRASVRFQGPDVMFRTQGSGLRSGAFADGDALAESLACGAPTRATVVVEDGAVVDVVTVPTVACVERRGRASKLDGLRLDDLSVSATTTAILVLDVPAEALCSR